VPRALQKSKFTRGDHSSRSRLAPRLQQPTRGLLSATTQLLALLRRKRFPLSRITLGEPGRLSPPIWPCTTRGFPCLRCCHRSGGLLPHLFTLTKRNMHFEDVPQVYLRDASVLLRRRSIFCGTFRERSRCRRSKPSPPEPLPRRYLARRPYSSPALASLRRRCPDFPPAQPSYDDQASDHPAHPLLQLYLGNGHTDRQLRKPNSRHGKSPEAFITAAIQQHTRHQRQPN
jgi:hypothetical protein